MFILLTNDDGIEAPGLHALSDALSLLPNARLAIIAPMVNRTGVGAQVSFGPLTVLEHAPIGGWPAWMVDGSPADAVSIGVRGIYLESPPDLVVSGVNQGLNLGRIVVHSGTVGAAMRAALLGVPALAVSSQTTRTPQRHDFMEAAHLARRLLEGWLAGDGLPLDPADGGFLSLNVPRGYNGTLRWTRQGRRYFRQRFYRPDADGVTYHPQLEIDSLEPHAQEALAEGDGTDVGALARGFATLTPLRPVLFSPESYARLGPDAAFDLPPLYPSIEPAESDPISLPPGAEVREG